MGAVGGLRTDLPEQREREWFLFQLLIHHASGLHPNTNELIVPANTVDFHKQFDERRFSSEAKPEMI